MRATESPARGVIGIVARLRDMPSGALVAAVGLLALMGLFLFFPLQFSPTEPYTGPILAPPSATHWIGTDGNGIDVFTRTLVAGRRDLPIAVVATALALLIGVPLGLAAGTKGRAGEWLMRGLDVFQAFPLLVLAVVLVAVLARSTVGLIIAILIINIPRFMRLVRGEALSIRELRFVDAARVAGAGPIWIMRKHVLRNIWGIILAQASLGAAHSLVVVAALSFLGLGNSPPDPTWGSMIQSGARGMAAGHWWLVVGPGLAIFVCVGLFNLAADSLSRRAART